MPPWGAQCLGLCLWRSLQRNLSHSPHSQGYPASLGSCPESVPSPIWRPQVRGKGGETSLPLRQRNFWRSRFKWCWPKVFPIPEKFSLRRTCLHISPQSWQDSAHLKWEKRGHWGRWLWVFKNQQAERKAVWPPKCVQTQPPFLTPHYGLHIPTPSLFRDQCWENHRVVVCCCVLLRVVSSSSHQTRVPWKLSTKRVTEQIHSQVRPSRSQIHDLRVPPHFSNFCCTYCPVYPSPGEPT